MNDDHAPSGAGTDRPSSDVRPQPASQSVDAAPNPGNSPRKPRPASQARVTAGVGEVLLLSILAIFALLVVVGLFALVDGRTLSLRRQSTAVTPTSVSNALPLVGSAPVTTTATILEITPTVGSELTESTPDTGLAATAEPEPTIEPDATDVPAAPPEPSATAIQPTAPPQDTVPPPQPPAPTATVAPPPQPTATATVPAPTVTHPAPTATLPAPTSTAVVQPTSTLQPTVAAPSPTPAVVPTQPVVQAVRDRIVAAVDGLHSGELVASLESKQAGKSSAQISFDFGDAQNPPRYHLLTTFQGPKNVQTAEYISVGNRQWQRHQGGTWTEGTEQEGARGQIQAYLPNISSIPPDQAATGAQGSQVNWYDASNDADVTLRIDPATGIPLEMRQVTRASGAILSVTYNSWNRPVNITPP
ncbi:MAG: hypothetical protein ABI670_08645 [Chloroflexota bacterium]